MIENVTVPKASVVGGRLLFLVSYFEPEKRDREDYFRTTIYGTEAQMRGLLKSLGVPDAEIGQLFTKAKREFLSELPRSS